MLNLLLAGFVELADDEAYYWYFSLTPAWGYFDHPPMTPWLIALTRGLGGELGVRFAVTLLQPLGLYLFWTLIRPAKPSWSDAWLYFLIVFSIPLLQLYGFIATPDAPLMFFTVFFLWSFSRFSLRDTVFNATLMAVAMALLMYSKYHGLLVILFALCTQWHNFRSWKLYYAGLLALILFLPHLWWQYQHDFASLRYHLVDRVDDGLFAWGNIGGYLLGLLLAFNPLWTIPSIGWMHRVPRQDDNSSLIVRKALLFIAIGFIGFFLISSLRDNTQAQWLLPVAFAFVALTFDAATNIPRVSRYVRIAAMTCGVAFLIVRTLLLFNPFDFQGQLWHNREDNKAIAEIAEGRPVMFMQDYTASCKYYFYTGNHPTYTLPYLYGRTSQWQYDDIDTAFCNEELVVSLNENAYADTIILPSGRPFMYVTIPHFKPLRKVEIESEFLQKEILADSVIPIRLTLYNPYHYNIASTDENPLMITFITRITQRNQPETNFPLTTVLPAMDTASVTLRLPATCLPPDGSHPYGFSLRYAIARSCINSPWHHIEITHNADTVKLNINDELRIKKGKWGNSHTPHL